MTAALNAPGAPGAKAPQYTDAQLRKVLNAARSIAIVGVSANPVRPSNYVASYMKTRGYRVIGVNPGLAGQTHFGSTVCESLSAIPESFGEIHMVDIFRRSEAALAITEEAISALKARGLKSIWMQIGVINPEAEALAKSHGLDVIMNRCPKMEYQRLVGELSWGGVNSGIISSRLR